MSDSTVGIVLGRGVFFVYLSAVKALSERRCSYNKNNLRTCSEDLFSSPDVWFLCSTPHSAACLSFYSHNIVDGVVKVVCQKFKLPPRATSTVSCNFKDTFLNT